MALDIPKPFPVYRVDASIPYQEVASRQEACVSQGTETLFLCEHPSTITLGTAATPSDLVFPALYYERMGITVVKSPRGGKATYHGAGQLVGYPILNLRKRNLTIHGYLRLLETLMIRVCKGYGLEAYRIEGKAGCWIANKKIGFIGVRVRKGFSFHGFSLNVTPQQNAFKYIVPCGMPDLSITSLQEESGKEFTTIWPAADSAESLFFELLYGADWNKQIA